MNFWSRLALYRCFVPIDKAKKQKQFESNRWFEEILTKTGKILVGKTGEPNNNKWVMTYLDKLV